MFKNIIITIFTILITASYSLADPVPVFCLAGWIDACKEFSTATEYNRSKLSTTKRYNFQDTNITEYDISKRATTKRYNLNADCITEYDISKRATTKRFNFN